MSEWIRKSLIGKIIFSLTTSEIYVESNFLQSMRSLRSAVARLYSGSYTRLISLGEFWESTAIKDSGFLKPFFGVESEVKRIVDEFNSIIHRSIWFNAVRRFCEAMVLAPFKTISHFLFSQIAVAATLGVVFAQITARQFLMRIGLSLLFAATSLIEVSTEDVIDTSMMGRVLQWLWGEEFVGKRLGGSLKAGRKGDFWALVISGGVLGVLQFYLPGMTFLKLLGVILFPALVYLWPGWGISAAALVLPLISTTYTVAIIGITFISVLLNYRRYRPTVPCGIIPASFFIIIAVLSSLFSFARADSLKSLPLYAAYFMVYYCAAVLYSDKKTLKTGLSAHIISATLVALYGIYQYFFLKISTSISWVDTTQFPELTTRVYSTLENPNVLAEYLVLVIPLVLAIAWVSKGFWKKSFALVIVSIMSLCLILTFSRGAWIGMAASILVYSLLKAPSLAVFAILLAMISSMFLPPMIIDRIASIGSLEDSSNAYRISIWIAVARIIGDYWFTGIGLGLVAFSRIYHNYMIAGTYALHAHNLYLQIAAEMGIFGVIAFVWLASSSFSRVFLKADRAHWSSFILVGASSAIAGHLLHGMFEYIWYSPKVILAYWMTLGMISGLSQFADEESGVVGQ